MGHFGHALPSHSPEDRGALRSLREPSVNAPLETDSVTAQSTRRLTS